MGHDDFTRPERPSHVTPGVIWDYSGGYNERFDFQGNTFNLTTQHSHMTKLNEETFPGKCFGTEPTKHLHRTNQDRNALVQEGLQHDIIKRSVVTNHGRLFFLQPFWDIFTTWRCTRFQSEMYIHQFDSLCVCEYTSNIQRQYHQQKQPDGAHTCLTCQSECQSSETWKLSRAVAYKRMERIAQTCL